MSALPELPQEQKDKYREQHNRVKRAMDDWYWSGHVYLFLGEKSLEKELADLEQLSITAYKAAQLLKNLIADNKDLSED